MGATEPGGAALRLLNTNVTAGGSTLTPNIDRIHTGVSAVSLRSIHAYASKNATTNLKIAHSMIFQRRSYFLVFDVTSTDVTGCNINS